MTQYFIESKGKDPQFFCFSQIIHENVDYNELQNKIQEDFDKCQQENWQIYWSAEGENIILQTWNTKYKDYLQNDKGFEDESELIDKEDKKSTIDAIENIELVADSQTAEDEGYLNSWNDLWEQHREEIYLEQYIIFTTIFYNHYLEFKNSLNQILPTQEGVEEDTTYFGQEYTHLSEELDQLKLLGLPTSFASRPQNSNTKSKNRHKTSHFSDFFSESDTENNSSELSDMDESLLEDDSTALHGIEKKQIEKRSQKAKKKNRKLKNVPSFILEEKGLLKYWRKRFSLFSRFDEGIRLDRESWFSVTPEKVAKHMAERLRCSIIVDGFCGSGGNAIQFASTCDKVIAIDIDPVKLEMAKHNAQIYNVSHKIEFILGDFLQLASTGKLKADIVFLSPPWGGPKYKNKKDYNIEKYLLPVKASELVDVARNVSNNVALFLPRNSNIKQIIKLAGIGNSCEIEHNYLDSRLVAITALYGEEILQKKSSDS